MLEWLKEILGDSYTEDIDAKVSAEIGKSFVSKTDFNEKNDALKAANKTIVDLQDAAKKYDGVDIDGLKKQIKDAKDEYDAKLAAVKLDSAIDVALAGSKVRSNKAARAMLNMDDVKFGDDGTLTGLSDQLAELQKTDAWLFDSTQQIDTGAEHGGAGSGTEVDGVTKAFMALNPGLKME